MAKIKFSDEAFAWRANKKPAQAEVVDNGNALKVTSSVGLDWWRTPERDSQDGEALVMPISTSKDFKVSVTLQGDYVEQFDQATLFLEVHSAGELRWAKAGPEFDDGKIWLGAVVTTVFSDWAITTTDSPSITSETQIRVTFSRTGHKLQINAVALNGAATSIPIYTRAVNGFFTVSKIEDIKVGIMACTPLKQNSGVKATFSDFEVVHE